MRKYKERVDNTNLLTIEQILQKKLLTGKEASRVLGISYNTLLSLNLPSVKNPVGRRLMYRIETILEIKNQLT